MNTIKKLMSYDGLYWFCMIIFFTIISLPFFCRVFETDMYFILPEGKNILQTCTLPDTNRFIIDDNQLIIHQWLYSVICALLFYSSNENPITLYFLTVLQMGLLLFIMCKYCRLYFKRTHFELCIYLILFSSPYLRSIRPELITIIIMMLEIYCFEKYKITGKFKWLLGLPLSMILMVNFHAMMWPILYAVLLAYMVPSVLPKLYVSNNIKLNIHVMSSILLSVLTIGVNPYGYKVIPLIFNAMRISRLFGNEVSELKPFITCVEHMFQSSFSFDVLINLLLFLLSVILILVCFIKKIKLKSSSLYLFCGFTVMLFMNLRNCMFFVLGFALLLCSIFDIINIDSFSNKLKNNFNIFFKEKWLNYLLCVSVCFFSIFIIIFNIFWFITLCCLDFKNMYGTRHITTDVIDFINADYSDDSIFSSFDYNSYLIYNGFDNLYADVRMEYLDNESLIRSENYLRLISAKKLEDIKLIGYDSVDDFVNRYDFSYFVLREDISAVLIEYLDSHPDKYECVHFDNYVLDEFNKFDDRVIDSEEPYLECVVYKRIKD